MIRNDQSVSGTLAFNLKTKVCSNDECRKITLKLIVFARNDHDPEFPMRDSWEVGNMLYTWDLLPESTAKPQPEYIPKAIVDSYTQACRIKSLSPMASATLARRCLQGMVRDFCVIEGRTLWHELQALQDAVDADTAPGNVTPESVLAIDHVRQIGNIGAHMEKDIDLIVDIDPGEADTLIELIELLFKEWYVARRDRADTLERLKKTAEDKRTPKKETPESGNVDGQIVAVEGSEEPAPANRTDLIR